MRKRYGKYNAKGTHTPDGYFDSKGELKRWGELKWLEKANQITNLQRQIKFKFEVNGIEISTYVADYQYNEPGTAKPIIEEFKGHWTPEAKIKARLFKALYGQYYEFRVSGAGLRE
jgi:hypothetical protein